MQKSDYFPTNIRTLLFFLKYEYTIIDYVFVDAWWVLLKDQMYLLWCNCFLYRLKWFIVFLTRPNKFLVCPLFELFSKFSVSILIFSVEIIHVLSAKGPTTTLFAFLSFWLSIFCKRYSINDIGTLVWQLVWGHSMRQT